MDKPSEQQAFELLRKSSNLLLALPQHLTADSLAAGLALAKFLRKLDKEILVASSGKIPKELGFLPGTGDVVEDIPSGKNFVISVDTTQKKLQEISYQSRDGRVEIFLQGQDSQFSPQDVSFGSSGRRFDLIITMGAASLDDLGDLFKGRAELFYDTPKVNIDHHPANEYFGAINLVDITASSLGEMLAVLLDQFETALIDEDIATCLLAGIITKTHSFQQPQTTPKAFLQASRLVEAGARQQEIIHHLFKTKEFSLLKLLGRALARLKTDDGLSLVYSLLNQADFEKSQAGGDDAEQVIREMLETVSGYRLGAVVAEGQQGSRLFLAAHQSLPEHKLLETFGQMEKLRGLPQHQVFSVAWPEKTLPQAEARLLEAARLLGQPAAV